MGLKFELGDKLIDNKTGLIGEVSARTEWAVGIKSYCLTFKDSNGWKTMEPIWINEEHLIRINKESKMKDQKMCIKTFNITKEQAEFVKNGGEFLNMSQSRMLRNLLDEAMNPKNDFKVEILKENIL